jgi:transposase-like protein
LADQVKPLGGKNMGAGWYHCGQCRAKFTGRIGSIFERSHVPLHKWLHAFRLMAAAKKGVSAHQLHRTLGITYKSAWFMAHRVREAMTDIAPAPLGGSDKTVEADETCIDTKEGRKKARAGYGHKRVVVSVVERGGNTSPE